MKYIIGALLVIAIIVSGLYFFLGSSALKLLGVPVAFFEGGSVGSSNQVSENNITTFDSPEEMSLEQ